MVTLAATARSDSKEGKDRRINKCRKKNRRVGQASVRPSVASAGLPSAGPPLRRASGGPALGSARASAHATRSLVPPYGVCAEHDSYLFVGPNDPANKPGAFYPYL